MGRRDTLESSIVAEAVQSEVKLQVQVSIRFPVNRNNHRSLCRTYQASICVHHLVQPVLQNVAKREPAVQRSYRSIKTALGRSAIQKRRQRLVRYELQEPRPIPLKPHEPVQEKGNVTRRPNCREREWWNFLRELAPQAGFEPATLRLTAGCSTIELLRNKAAASSKHSY